MELGLILLGIAIAAGAGFFFGRKFSVGLGEQTRLEQELKASKEELEAFRNKVTTHFEKTADLFNHVSDSYQSLYDHMAKSSSQLCSSPSFQALPKNQEPEVSVKPHPQHKSNTDSSYLFDAKSLYNAHDYRNLAVQPTEEVAEEKDTDTTSKVVDIESAKEDRNEPALDYAIKADGVINHNSLDVDGVKSS